MKVIIQSTAIIEVPKPLWHRLTQLFASYQKERHKPWGEVYISHWSDLPIGWLADARVRPRVRKEVRLFLTELRQSLGADFRGTYEFRSATDEHR